MQLASSLWIPITFNSVGTILAALILGPWMGALVGLCSHLIWALMWGPSVILFAPTSILIGFAAGVLKQNKMFRSVVFAALSGVFIMLFARIMGAILANLFLIFFSGSDTLAGDISALPVQFQVLSFSDVISCLIAYAITTQLPEQAFLAEKPKRGSLLSESTDKTTTITLELEAHALQTVNERAPNDDLLDQKTKGSIMTNTEEKPSSSLSADRVMFYLIFAAAIFVLGSMLLGPRLMAKPVIYLYPEKTTTVSVLLDFEGTLTHTYPAYRDGWTVTASPDGTLINHADNKEYSYLFWEGDSKRTIDMSRGFVVKGSDTAAFLQEKLALIGLRPKEYNEFIVYWLPHMENNRYNLIAFQEKDYTDSAELTITPKPDSILRVFMTYKPLTLPVTIPPQELKPFVRRGFTVVEWGGAKVSR